MLLRKGIQGCLTQGLPSECPLRCRLCTALRQWRCKRKYVYLQMLSWGRYKRNMAPLNQAAMHQANQIWDLGTAGLQVTESVRFPVPVLCSSTGQDTDIDRCGQRPNSILSPGQDPYRRRMTDAGRMQGERRCRRQAQVCPKS